MGKDACEIRHTLIHIQSTSLIPTNITCSIILKPPPKIPNFSLIKPTQYMYPNSTPWLFLKPHHPSKNLSHAESIQFQTKFLHGEGCLWNKTYSYSHTMDNLPLIVKWYSWGYPKIRQKSKTNYWVIIFNTIIRIKIQGIIPWQTPADPPPVYTSISQRN